MTHQASFSSNDKSTKIKVSSAAILFRAIRVNIVCYRYLVEVDLLQLRL